MKNKGIDFYFCLFVYALFNICILLYIPSSLFFDFFLRISIAFILWNFVFFIIKNSVTKEMLAPLNYLFIIGYYLKFLITFFFPDYLLSNWMLINLSDVLLNKSMWLSELDIINLAYLGFFISLIFLKSSRKRVNDNLLIKKNGINLLYTFHKFTIPFLIICSSYIMVKFNIGNMGENDSTTALPFRLGGWIFYLRVVYIVFSIFVLFYIKKFVLNKKPTFEIILLLFYALSDMFIRASKGTFLIMLIMLFLIFYFEKKWKKEYNKFVFFTLIISIILFPLLSVYRVYRVLNPNENIFSLITNSTNLIHTIYDNTENNYLFEIVKTFFARLQGADNLALILFKDIPILNYNLAGINNIEQYVDSYLNITGAAPTLIGTFYLLGGKLFVFIGFFLWGTFTMNLFKLLNRSFFYLQPVIKAWFCFWILIITGEGTLDLQMFFLSVSFFTIFFNEFLIRIKFKIT